MEKIINFLFETGQLKRVKRSGWWLAGVKDPETVAEHSHRAAILAYFLAKLEKKDPYKTVMMMLFHDIPESRINDLHKVGQKYINHKSAEKEVFKEQISNLNIDIASELANLIKNYGTDGSQEGIIAKDADYLECALTAKEYIELGYKETQNWLNNIEKVLKTDSAKELFKIICKTNSTNWWKELKKIQR